MTIIFAGLPVANVELADSFNTWRLTTNKILNDAASLTANNTFAGTLTVSGSMNVASMNVASLNATDITANSVTVGFLFDNSNRLLTIRDEANTVVWGN